MNIKQVIFMIYFWLDRSLKYTDVGKIPQVYGTQLSSQHHVSPIDSAIVLNFLSAR